MGDDIPHSYIERLEAERDALVAQNAELRAALGEAIQSNMNGTSAGQRYAYDKKWRKALALPEPEAVKRYRALERVLGDLGLEHRAALKGGRGVPTSVVESILQPLRDLDQLPHGSPDAGTSDGPRVRGDADGRPRDGDEHR